VLQDADREAPVRHDVDAQSSAGAGGDPPLEMRREAAGRNEDQERVEQPSVGPLDDPLDDDLLEAEDVERMDQPHGRRLL